jgi:stage V sporulation protein B
LYPGKDASLYIKLLAPLIPVMYIDTTVDSMLKGLGEQIYNMSVNILDSLLSVLLVWLLLPRMGIVGYVVTLYVAELVNAAFSVTRLIQKSGMIPQPLKWVGKPLLCIVGATAMAHILSRTSRKR